MPFPRFDQVDLDGSQISSYLIILPKIIQFLRIVERNEKKNDRGIFDVSFQFHIIVHDSLET